MYECIDAPGGHSARILSFKEATDVAGGYVLGPMSVPSERRNLSSNSSSAAAIYENPMTAVNGYVDKG